jgi:copper(I)-binding protein
LATSLISSSLYKVKIMKLKSFVVGTALSATFAATAAAQTVDIKDAWVRTSVPGQKATGVFMKITAKEAVKLVGLSSPAAALVELHEMKMEGDVMKMRAVAGGLDLPAGKTVELKPGGYHIMLMDLNAPLAKDSSVALTLMFKDAKGVASSVALRVPVAAVAPGMKIGDKAAMDVVKY